jgi:hypothetical protein
VGDFVGTAGRSVGGLVSGSIHAISVAFDTIVGTLQFYLPGPLFPITMVAIALGLVWIFRKTIL